nr:helix-turn-helix domain-containing protein [Kibdelosporangium sp. MJ126-NF4]CEL19786.1 putative transcriptional regulator [Kibdelosporangium sp. MJ126-NF4]CTQ97011.1 putative transcriptional regulator [Kibdelosporangium sp. MJ126-NF4]
MGTDPAGQPVSPVVAAVLSRVDEIAGAVVARAVREIPAYQLLPVSVLDGDLVANARAVLELFLTVVVAERRAPTEEELELPIAWGAERARDGLPLDAVLKVYPIGAQEAWRLARSVAGDDESELIALTEQILEFLAVVIPQVAQAYLREREDIDWEQREHRQNLAGNLLAGRPAHRAAQRSNRTLAERYDVVAFHVRAASADTSTRATINLFRAIQAELDAEPEVLVTFEGDGGVLLVPAPATPSPNRESRSQVARLLARIDKAAGSPCVAGAATAATHAGIPAAHDQATEVLTLADRLGRPPGQYWLADLAVEYQLAQPGAARTALAEVLSPLAGHDHLIEALRVFVATGYSRSDAAAALNVHRNTLTYRLDRVRALTGYDATQPADARRLAAALTAHDIIGQETGS